MLGHPDAWWNAVLKAAVKSASVAVLQQSQALHLILSHHLPWAVEALIERQVDINAAAGKEINFLIKAKKKINASAGKETWKKTQYLGIK
jgi:hypothetical protein